MKLAIVGSLIHATREETKGGTEVFNYEISKELKSRNYDIQLFVSGDSKVEAKIYKAVDRAILDTGEDFNNADLMRRASFDEIVGFAKSMEFIKKNRFDLIHHSHFNFLPVYLGYKFKIPQLVTLHLPPNSSFVWNLEKILAEDIKEINYISVSKAQQKNNKEIHYFSNIYNGIDLKKFPFQGQPQNYYHWIGRIVPEKGAESAIIIAKRSKIKLKFTGIVQNKQYYEERIRSFEHDRQIEFVKNVSFAEKVEIIRNSRAFINPIQWEEPFGLVMIEAMACGTPVIAFRRGSVPEIIKDGETGFVCQPDDIDCMVRKVKEINEMPEEKYQAMRKECRQHVEENFSVKKMVDGYEKVYQEVMDDWRKKHE